MRVTLPTVVSFSSLLRSSPSAQGDDLEDGAGDPDAVDSQRKAHLFPSESDIPPVIACAHCGDPRCDGCTPASKRPEPELGAQLTVPWERRAASWNALTETAIRSAVGVSEFFGQLGKGSVTAAIAFALLCESCAIFAYSLIWALGAFAFFPRLTWQVLSTPLLMVFAAGIFLGLVGFVVFVHALAGAALEWSIGRTVGQADYNRGLRMGLYSCGWDLLTSPVGVYLALSGRPRMGAFTLFAMGATVPRKATVFYLKDCRRLGDLERRQAMRTAIVSMLLPVTLLAATIFVAILWWLLFPFFW